MWFSNRSDTKIRLYSYRSRLEARNFRFRKKRKCTIRVAKTKALISFVVTAKLICVFVFAYADCWFSHEAAGINCLKNCLLFCPVLVLGNSTNSYFSYCFVTSNFAALNTVVILY